MGRVRQQALRPLRPRPVLQRPLRLLRLQHLHRQRARRRGRRQPVVVRRGRDPRDPLRPAGARPPRRARSRRSSSAAAPRRCSSRPTSVRSWPAPPPSSASPTAWRSPPRPTPTASPPGTSTELRTAGFNRVSFGMQSAVDHVLRTLDRTHDPHAGAGRRRVGPPGRLRGGQPRPDLRHAGGVAGGLGDLGGGGPVLPPRPRLGVLPHRRGGHRARPPGAPRRGADDRRRRPRRQVPARRRAVLRGRDEVVRGVQLGHVARPLVPAQPASTGPAPTGGASDPARTPTSAARGGGTSSTPRRTPTGSPAASPRPWPARSSATATSAPSGSCSRSASSRDSR